MCDSGVTVPQNRIMLFNRTFQLRTENDPVAHQKKEAPTS